MESNKISKILLWIGILIILLIIFLSIWPISFLRPLVFQNIYLFFTYFLIGFVLIILAGIICKPQYYSKLAMWGFGLGLVVLLWFLSNMGYPVLLTLFSSTQPLFTHIGGYSWDFLNNIFTSMQIFLSYIFTILLVISFILNIWALAHLRKTPQLKGKIYSILGIIFSIISLILFSSRFLIPF